MYYFSRDFTPLAAALRKHELLLGGLSCFASEPLRVNARERALCRGGISLGKSELLKTTGPGGMGASTLDDTPRPTFSGEKPWKP